jgi:hypothetical protein
VSHLLNPLKQEAKRTRTLISLTFKKFQVCPFAILISTNVQQMFKKDLNQTIKIFSNCMSTWSVDACNPNYLALTEKETNNNKIQTKNN